MATLKEHEGQYFCASLCEMSDNSSEFVNIDQTQDGNQKYGSAGSIANSPAEKTPTLIFHELRKKSNYGLRSGKHERQRFYSVLFRKKTKTVLSRIKKKSILMQMINDTDNKCSGYCFEEISLMYAKYADIKEELESYTSRFGVIKDDMSISEKMSLFTNVVKFLKVELEPCSVRAAFYKLAQNIDEVDKVRASNKKLSTDISSVFTERQATLVDKVKKYQNVVQTVFGCVKTLELNSQYLMDLFGRSALKHLSNDMVLYWNFLVDIKSCTVSMIHVDGKYYSSPAGWKQSFEIVAVLKNRENMTKSVSLGFALLKSATQENYTLLFKRIKDYKFLNIKNIMLDFEVAIYNAAKSIFPKCMPRGCYYHYRNNVVKRAAKLKRWLGKTVSNFTQNVLSLAPFVFDPVEFLYQAILNIQANSYELFKDCNFKIIMYVYETYVLKLKSFFKINLSEELIRTNNACEGRNSALKRNFSFRPQISNLVDYICTRFKKDSVKKFTAPSDPIPYDLFFINVQKMSNNIPLLIKFCEHSSPISVQNAERLLETFDLFCQSWSACIEETDICAGLKMTELKLQYRSFNNEMKQKWSKIKSKYKELEDINNDLDDNQDQCNYSSASTDITFDGPGTKDETFELEGFEYLTIRNKINFMSKLEEIKSMAIQLVQAMDNVNFLKSVEIMSEMNMRLKDVFTTFDF